MRSGYTAPMIRRLTVLAVALALAAAARASIDAKDRVIDLTQRVGAVAPGSTVDQLKTTYGDANVRVSGDRLSAVLFPGRPDEVRVEFKSPGRSVSRVLISGRGGAWSTPDGLRVGTTLDELRKLNGGPFDITGLNWTEPARVVSWKGGHLPAQLYVDLGPEGEIKDATRRRLRNRQTFYDSESPVFRDFSVQRIVIEW